MPPVFLLAPFLHLTVSLVVAFLVLFAANWSEGWLRTAGHLLGTWLVVFGIAAFVLGMFGPLLHWGAPSGHTSDCADLPVIIEPPPAHLDFD